MKMPKLEIHKNDKKFNFLDNHDKSFQKTLENLAQTDIAVILVDARNNPSLIFKLNEI